MSFIAQSPQEENININNDGFFPDLSVDEFRDLHRVNSDYGNAVIASRIKLAISAINHSLTNFKAENITLNTLENYESQGNFAATDQYKAAVYYHAKAHLLTDYQTFTRRDIAENTAREGEQTQQDLLALSKQSVRWLNGQCGHATVELI